MIKSLFVISLVLAASSASPRVLNEVMDGFLATFRTMIKMKGVDTFPVHRISEKWHYDGTLVDFNGETVCWDGWIKPLSSIKRTGDVVMTTIRNETFFQFEVGFTDLQFAFKKCAITHYLTVSRPVQGSVDSNSVKWVISLRGSGKSCIAATEALEVVKLEGIHIYTGEGLLHETEDRMVEWLAQTFHKTIIDNVNRKLNELAKEHIREYDLCEKLPQLISGQ